MSALDQARSAGQLACPTRSRSVVRSVAISTLWRSAACVRFNRVRSFWTILRFFDVSSDRCVQLAGCAFSYPILREQLSLHGEPHIPCRRSVPDAADLCPDTVARFQTPSRVHRSISTGFPWRSTAAPINRNTRRTGRRQRSKFQICLVRIRS